MSLLRDQDSAPMAAVRAAIEGVLEQHAQIRRVVSGTVAQDAVESRLGVIEVRYLADILAAAEEKDAENDRLAQALGEGGEPADEAGEDEGLNW